METKHCHTCTCANVLLAHRKRRTTVLPQNLPVPDSSWSDDERREYYKHTGPYFDCLFYSRLTLAPHVRDAVFALLENIRAGHAGTLAEQKRALASIAELWRMQDQRVAIAA